MTRRIEVTREGSMLDEIVREAAGSDEGGQVEATLGLNPGLAQRLAGSVHRLAPRDTLTLPDPQPATPRLRRIALWD